MGHKVKIYGIYATSLMSLWPCHVLIQIALHWVQSRHNVCKSEREEIRLGKQRWTSGFATSDFSAYNQRSCQLSKKCHSALSIHEKVSSPLVTRREKSPGDDQAAPVNLRAKWPRYGKKHSHSERAEHALEVCGFSSWCTVLALWLHCASL